MALKLYEISTTLESHPDSRAILSESSYDDEVFSYFMVNRGNKEIIEKYDLEYLAGKGYTLKNIVKTDHISTFSALLFSTKFVECAGEVLSKEMQFFPCKVICKGVAFDWYAAKILRVLPIVDKELSKYRMLTDGKPILNGVKYREDIDEQFYIARDSESITYFAVSELFKNLCDKNNLMIKFTRL